MALTMFDGFEAWPLLKNAGTASAMGLAVGRDGVGKGIFSTNNNGYWFAPIQTTPVTAGILGFGMKPGLNGAFMRVMGNGGSLYHIGINHDATGRVQLVRSTAVLASSIGAVDRTAWHFYEIKFSIADTGGTAIVKEDGVEIINFTGDTRNGGLGTVDTIRFDGTVNAPSIDDVYFMDLTGPAPYNNWIGERVIKAKYIIGQGGSSDWDGSDGDSVNNWDLVNEDPPNTSDFVSSNVPGDRDLYTLSGATGLASVDAVQASIYGSKSDSGARSTKILLRDDATGTVKNSRTVPMSTNWVVSDGAIEMTDPAGNAWTVPRANAIQAGIEVL